MNALVPAWRERRVIHLDADLVVVDKPAGVSCHSQEGDVDLPTRLARWLADRGEPPARLVAPLDREASGVVLLGRSREARRRLNQDVERGLGRSWVAGVERIAEGWRLRDRREGRLLVERRSAARSQPARRWLTEGAAPAAGDRDAEGPPWHRLLLHLATCDRRDGGRFEAPLPDTFADWLEARPFPADLTEPLEDAVDLRYALDDRDDTDAFRLIHGAGDGLPGVDVDLYGAHAVVALRGDEALRREESVLDAVAALGVAGVYVKRRPKKASTLVDTRRDEVAPSHAVRGRDAEPSFVIHEAGIPYEARLGDGLSTGIFLDQRDARIWLRERSGGKRVLNLFCYHAAFTVAAIAGGARATVSVDNAPPALERAASNLARLASDNDAHELVRDDALRYLERAARRSERFDLVVLDPPSYATARRGRRGRTFRVGRDYPRLAALALALLEPGGQLLACTNHRGIVPSKLRAMLRRAARDAKVTVSAMYALPTPSDHPAAPGSPGHLKRFVVEVAG